MRQNIQIQIAEPNTGVLNYAHLLDAPAGKHGFVQVRKGHFYFEDGTRARFLGFNVAARSNTPDHETADKMAERFASMGVNVIRLHAADAPIGEAGWSSYKEAPLLDYTKGNGLSFHPEGLDRFDYFAAKLKEKGIYLHIDLIVARDFREGDGLDYPGNPGSCLKRYPMYNERLIELQQEYARMLLTHVNPYTGLALIDDSAVMTIQINNEESAIKGTVKGEESEDARPYQEEVQSRFNHYLLMKYHTRQRLKEAWTCDGVCALGEDEDPAQGTVLGVDGDFYQPVNEPMGQWDAPCGPARYADFMEFGIHRNRQFYQRMKDFLHSLGAKVPIVCSNLLAGAADVYGHTDGDLMENNSYFNHPIFPLQGNNTYLLAGPMEYVSTNPLTMQKGLGSMGTTLLSLASVAIVEGKPFMLSEWNEYGEHPFHSTALAHTIAYASLNDWDGLILYNHHTSERWDNQPADEILSVFDVYNDPAVICQWGFLATVFLKGLIAPSAHRVDVVYTQNDIKTLPNFHAMPMTFLPYVTAMRNVFLDGGEAYRGDGDAAVNAGFLNGADLSQAAHGVWYAWSPYRDAMRRYPEKNRLERAARGTRLLEDGVHLGDKALVFDDISAAAQNGDYRKVAALVDQAMKEWGIWPEGTGYVDGRLISDTGELVFDPEHSRFHINTPYCAYFSGAPEERIVLSDRIEVHSENERITLALLPRGNALLPKGNALHSAADGELIHGETVDGKQTGEKIVGDRKTADRKPADGEPTGIKLDDAKEYVLTAMGTSGMDETVYQPGPEMMGFTFTSVVFRGKLYAETLEGSICVKAAEAKLTVLSPTGAVLEEVEGIKTEDGIRFELTGRIRGMQYHLQLR